MLQAATGKLFANRLNPRTNALRGVVYTNLDLGGRGVLHTAVGTLSRFDCSSTPRALCYEMDELIEGELRAGGLVSRSMNAYIDDFADVVSFGLRAICSPDVRTAERLLQQRPRSGEHHPSNRLSRFYEPSVLISTEELKAFEHFVDQLVGMKRIHYLAALQAIRTYVAAVHRMRDDLNLAYTLLVISIESLAQKFDGYEAVWADVPEQKRRPIDDALQHVDADHAQAVREAVLSSEHLRLGHRFTQFILTYLPKDYFSGQAINEQHPVGKRDLEAALKNLYGTRSNYVHTLKPLTNEFIHFSGVADIYNDDGNLMFSFQGLFRLVRAVIIEFVNQAEQVEHEPCAYEKDNPNLLRLKADPSHWLYRPASLNTHTSPRYFQGLVHLISRGMDEYPDRAFRSLRPLIEKGFSIKSQLSKPSKLAFLALVYLRNRYMAVEEGEPVPDPEDLELMDEPSVVMLIATALAGVMTDWPPSVYAEQLERYYAQRFKPTGVAVPLLVEACMALALVERYRLADQPENARMALVSAIEDFPQLAQVREIEVHPDTPVAWWDIIYPKCTEGRVPTLECHGL